MQKIKIAVDSCVVIMLSRLASPNLNAKDKALLDCVKQRTLTPELYENVPSKHVPSLLKDKYFAQIEVGEDGKKYYNNLNNMYSLLKKVESGKVELYITPTVFGELDFEWFEDTMNFIQKYVNVIQISDEDSETFYRKRNNLAWEYVRKGAMCEQFNASLRVSVPENDAFIMAEASLCGLLLVTANNKDFINLTRWKDDYKRLNIIEQVNTEAGLVFNSNIRNYKIPAQPMSVNSFVMKSKYRKDARVRPYYIVNPSLEGNVYKAELSK